MDNKIVSLVKSEPKTRTKYTFILYTGEKYNTENYTVYGEGIGMTELESAYIVYSNSDGDVSDIIPKENVHRIKIEYKVVENDNNS